MRMSSTEIGSDLMLREDRRVHRAATPVCDRCGNATRVAAVKRTPLLFGFWHWDQHNSLCEARLCEHQVSRCVAQYRRAFSPLTTYPILSLAEINMDEPAKGTRSRTSSHRDGQREAQSRFDKTVRTMRTRYDPWTRRTAREF